MIVAFQCDDRLQLRKRERREPPEKLLAPLRERGLMFWRWNGISSIGFARAQVESAGVPTGEPPLVARPVKLDPPHFHPAGDRLDDPIILGDAHFEIARGEQKYRVFWGDLHRHSSISRCSGGFEPGPADRWASGRDVHLCDFMALTDHTGALEPVTWWQLDKLGALYRSKGFCTLLGWEWSTDAFGHHNVILRGRMTPVVSERDTLSALYEQLPAGDCVTIPHHSAYFDFPNGFEEIDDRFTRLVEVYQACRGNFEFDGCYKQSASATALGSFLQDGLSMGRRFGIIASSDHGNGQAYACVLAERLEREDVFAALHARRTYGATTKGMLVDFRVGDALMGEEIALDGPAKLSLSVKGTAELADVVVFKDGKVLRSLREGTPRLASSYAPVRLELEVAAAANDEALELGLTIGGATFEPLIVRSNLGVKRAIPGWQARGESAAFKLPAAATTTRFPVHCFARPGATLVVKGPEGEQQVALDRPADGGPLLRGTTAGGTKWTLELVLGDAAIDVAKGLGTREYRGEWTDEPTSGASSWYYARVIQVDGEMAWSSPIFVQPKDAGSR
jgi:hypothetical protein